MAAFPGSFARPIIFEWWKLHRDGLTHLVAVDEQWVDGSFATNKDEPDDVDIAAMLSGPVFDALPPEIQLMVRMMTSGKYTRSFWRVDSYLVLRWPTSHPLHALGEKALAYWAKQWGHTRPDPTTGMQQAKGYLVVA